MAANGPAARQRLPQHMQHVLPRNPTDIGRQHTSNERSKAKMVDRCSSGTSSANRAELLQPHQLRYGGWEMVCQPH